MQVDPSLLRRHVLESNRIEGIRALRGPYYTSHLTAAHYVVRRAAAGSLCHPLVLHGILSRDTEMEVFGGTYRQVSVWVGMNRMPNWQEVPRLMAWWCEQVARLEYTAESERDHAILLLHDLFLHIHPFQDGNGRTARLVLNNLRLKYGLPWQIIESENRPTYYSHIKSTEPLFKSEFPNVYD